MYSSTGIEKISETMHEYCAQTYGDSVWKLSVLPQSRNKPWCLYTLSYNQYDDICCNKDQHYYHQVPVFRVFHQLQRRKITLWGIFLQISLERMDLQFSVENSLIDGCHLFVCEANCSIYLAMTIATRWTNATSKNGAFWKGRISLV